LNTSGEQLRTVTTFITRRLIGILADDGKWIVSTLKKYRSSVQTSHTCFPVVKIYISTTPVPVYIYIYIYIYVYVVQADHSRCVG
jgi:hypothetical protein